jgi:DegV family protein with EDD domain
LEEIKMENYEIVVDSSSNLYNKEKVSVVPLTISLGSDTYIDDDNINTIEFLEKMENYSGKTTSSCPNQFTWLNSFKDVDEIYAISITSKLSGCYNALEIAKNNFEETNTKTKIFTFDSLTTGPELELFVEKINELKNNNFSFDEVKDYINKYKNKTHLMFMLKSLDNFAKNGRVNIAIAKLCKLLHLCIVGKGSIDGKLEPISKCRGEKKAINEIFDNMLKANYNGKKVRISHTSNLKAANSLKDLILEKFPNADITIKENKALCAYYTERFGLLVGFEE